VLQVKLNVPHPGLVKLVNSTAAGAIKIAAGAHETGAGAITCQIKRSRSPAYFNHWAPIKWLTLTTADGLSWRHRLQTVDSHFPKVVMAGWLQRMIPVWTCRVSDRSDVDLTFIKSSTTVTMQYPLYIRYIRLSSAECYHIVEL
jgi:hypothetical protein